MPHARADNDPPARQPCLLGSYAGDFTSTMPDALVDTLVVVISVMPCWRAPMSAGQLPAVTLTGSRRDRHARWSVGGLSDNDGRATVCRLQHAPALPAAATGHQLLASKVQVDVRRVHKSSFEQPVRQGEQPLPILELNPP